LDIVKDTSFEIGWLAWQARPPRPSLTVVVKGTFDLVPSGECPISGLQALLTGDERALPTRDRGPIRRFARDYVDARFSVGEMLIPVMVLVILLSFIDDLGIQSAVLIGLWAFFVLAVIDCLVAAWLVRRKLAAKFGKDKVEKVTWYTTMRALQFRGLRLPKPQVKRWAYPEL